ncbi:hypothetical protein [Lewinella sp. W8]|uniref:hypothetical protein n=1 Tax=Lewinella sp. W8 TaxID=2528208 RepID=UPI00106825F3|nr:hypothetical protein [Lewinella sp. W8]MTB53447.1 hypothetical protein [Lewinella sp. W8]
MSDQIGWSFQLMKSKMKTVQLFFTFYQSCVLVGVLINGACTIILSTWGIATFKYLFWFKVITLLLTYYFVSEIKAKEFIYYKNLGVSKRLLWTVAAFVEVVLFAATIMITFTLR